jgi:uncharacterized protein (DUF1015 family)
MAEIKPFRAWRYNSGLFPSVDELTSPLFDVVSQKQRESLYKNPYNSIHLSVPAGEHAPRKAADLLAQWKKENILHQDELPAIYVYYQYFSLPGSGTTYCRKGFICHIKAYDWPEKVIVRHESTIPGAVADRLDLLAATQLHVSPTHGLYTDTSRELEKYMDESIVNPLYETEDYQGVKDVLAVIHDYRIIRRFVEVLQNKQIILADGHHRYESSLVYRKKQMAANPTHTGQEAYNFHLMYLTNTEANHLCILPTHRLIKNLPGINEQDLLTALEKYFIIKTVENPYELNEIILGKQWAFGLILKDSTYKIRLKPEVFGQMSWQFPPEVKQLDLTVLHYFVIEKILGIPGKVQRKSENIGFSRSFSECLTKVMKEEAQMAFITRDISMEEIKKVCASGYTMPQKSTYFYPKVICGFVYSSILPDEFALPPCFGF